MFRLHALAACVATACLSLPSLAQDLPYAEANFLRKSAASSHAELQASQLALEKSESKEVKAFAEKMQAEVEKDAEALEKLAASKAVTLPRNPSKEQLAEIEALKALDGAAFDQRFAERYAVQAQEEQLALLKTGAQAKDPHVKDFAEQMRPEVEKQLKSGKALEATLNKRPTAAAKRP